MKKIIYKKSKKYFAFTKLFVYLSCNQNENIMELKNTLLQLKYIYSKNLEITKSSKIYLNDIDCAVLDGKEIGIESCIDEIDEILKTL